MDLEAAAFASLFAAVCEKLRTFSGTLSCKKKGKRIEYYIQTCQNGVRKETYVRKADVPKVLAQYQQKQKLKSLRRDLKEKLQSFSPEEQRSIRAAIRLYQKLDIFHAKEIQNQLLREERAATEHGRIPPAAEILPDGSRVRSRAEMVCRMLTDFFGLEVNYEVPIQTQEQFFRRSSPYIIDFVLKNPQTGKVLYWEHMGMISDPAYRERQRRKLHDYRQENLIVGKNLLITSSGTHLNAQRILWGLVRMGAVDPQKVLRWLKRLRKRQEEAVFPDLL